MTKFKSKFKYCYRCNTKNDDAMKYCKHCCFTRFILVNIGKPKPKLPTQKIPDASWMKI